MNFQATPSMSTSGQTSLSDSIKHEEEHDLPPPTPPTSASSSLQTFTLFPRLPPELRILILQHCLSNCYVVYRRMKIHPSFSFFNSLAPDPSSTIQYTDTHRLDKHKWMRLMLSGKLGWELGREEDGKVRKEAGTKEYWIYGRKWDEMVAFYREGGGSFDGDPEFRW